MLQSLTSELAWTSVVVAILAALVAWRDLPFLLAASLAVFRVGISTVYFAEYFDGSWTMIDDFVYLDQGADLLHAGLNPVSSIFTADGYEALQTASGGHHTLYPWWNMVAQYLFGEYYYAPVLLNVLITFVTAFLLSRTTQLLGFPKAYRTGLHVFYLLHWDVIAWSSFVNLKDCMVQMLTVAGMYCLLRFCQLRDWWSVAGFVLILQLFYWIRFYVPLLMLVSVVGWVAWQWNDPRKYLLIPLGSLAACFALTGVGDDLWQLVSIQSYVYGAAILLVSPLPWCLTLDEPFAFLFIPSWLHLLFLLPAVWGLWKLWQSSRQARLYLIYLLLVFSFYAVVQELRGPRQRFQIAFILAWIQFQFIWTFWPVRRTATIVDQFPMKSAQQLAA